MAEKKQRGICDIALHFTEYLVWFTQYAFSISPDQTVFQNHPPCSGTALRLQFSALHPKDGAQNLTNHIVSEEFLIKQNFATVIM